MSKFLLILTFYFDDSDDLGSIEKTFEAPLPKIGESVILAGRKIGVVDVNHILEEGFVEVICDATLEDALKIFDDDQWEIQVVPDPDDDSKRRSELIKKFRSLASQVMDAAMI